MVSPQIVAVSEALGSALLAGWLVVRFPDLVPRSIRASFVACAVSFLLLQLVGPATKWTMDATNSATALLLVVTPIFVCTFWSVAGLARSVASRVH